CGARGPPKNMASDISATVRMTIAANTSTSENPASLLEGDFAKAIHRDRLACRGSQLHAVDIHRPSSTGDGRRGAHLVRGAVGPEIDGLDRRERDAFGESEQRPVV